MMIQQMLAEVPLSIGASHPRALLSYLRRFPPALLSMLRRAGFRRTLRLAWDNSSYYRQRFLEEGIDVARARVPADLKNFYLTSEVLRQSPEALLCGKPDLVVESSGTTGHASRIFLSRRELDYNSRQAVILKALYDISEEDRVLSTLDYGFCLDGVLASNAIPYWKTFAVCVGRVDPVEIYRKFPKYRFNIVMSGTPWLARFTEVAQVEGRPYPLKLLVGGGGGGILKRTREWIESFWGAPLYMTYASTEAATVLGFECPARDGYHLNEFDFYVEILNPDAEGYGEVVITTVHRTVMPLIRYRTRDVARVIREKCPCGLPFRKLSPLRGRLDEIVASVWGNVHPDFFESILGGIHGLADDWQVALQEKEGKQTFVFRLELEDGPSRRDEIKREIFALVQEKHPLAWQACMQRLSEVEFAFLPKGSLRKGRKLLRLVDERRSPPVQ